MPRKLYVVRHGERVDYVFGSDWHNKYFQQDGTFNRWDLNLPESLPKRKNVSDYSKDSPITMMGLHQATITGQALKSAGIELSHVFCSPSYRCIQTTTNILKGMGLAEKLSINIEPGLFEWITPFYKDSRPKWFTPQELRDLGYNINTEYKSLMRPEEIQNLSKEPCEEWYRRAYKITSAILESLESYSNVLFGGHAGSLDACTRMLSGRAPRTENDLAMHIPYLSINTLVINDDGSKKVEPPPIPTFYHHENRLFKWEVLSKDTPKADFHRSKVRL